jgi:predicted flap endonuclease-1-like 5' DNA nuclease
MMYDTPQMYRWKDPSLPPQAPALQVYFEQQPQVNAEVTAETGIQSYDNVLVAIVAPMGMPKSNVAHEIERTLPDGTVKVNAEKMTKYAEQVRAFKAGLGAETLGTPLKDLIGMTPATIMNLKTRGIHTIEMLADMQDAASGDLMGFWDFRDKARKHIELREKNAPMVRVEALEAKHTKEKADMQRQIDELKALVGKRGPGRPKQAEAEAA